MEKFYTVKYLAELFQVSKATISQEIKDGRLPCKKIRGCIRISEVDLNTYLERCQINDSINAQKTVHQRNKAFTQNKKPHTSPYKIQPYYKIQNAEVKADNESLTKYELYKINLGKVRKEDIEKRKIIEKSNLYYTVYEVMKILGSSYDYVRSLCKNGKFKAINPDGHKWFIDIKAFNDMNYEDIPPKFIENYKKYLNKISKEQTT